MISMDKPTVSLKKIQHMDGNSFDELEISFGKNPEL